MKKKDPTLILAVVPLGLATVVAQILLIRELLVLFHGNELSTAMILAAWLVWTAAGSLLAGTLFRAPVLHPKTLAIFHALLAALLPLTLLLVRSAKILWAIHPGETIGPVTMLSLSFVLLGPFCLASGMLFVLGCILHGTSNTEKFRSPGTVHWLEGIGSGLGGLLFVVVLLPFLNHLQISLLISACLYLTALILSLAASSEIPNSRWSRGGPAVYATLALTSLGILVWQGVFLETKSRSWMWPGHEVLASLDTRYGNLATLVRKDEISFYENGLWFSTYPNDYLAEGAVHFPLLMHPEPKDVLLIGGGVFGLLHEMLKHPSVRRIDYVELDPQLIAFAEKLLPPYVSDYLRDPRVNLIQTDGRRFISRTREQYDVVIVNLPDPLTAQLNRFYTVEFFRQAKNVLHADGILTIGMTGAENIIGPTLAMTLSSLYRSLAEVFPEVLVLPGTTTRFFGSKFPDVLVANPSVLTQRIAQRNLEVRYVRDFYLFHILAPTRLLYVKHVLQSMAAPRLNLDLVPSCYYYGIIHWSAGHAPKLAALLKSANQVSQPALLAGATAFGLILWAMLLLAKTESRKKTALLSACLIMGFSQMTLYVLLILFFQIMFGSVYHQVALLITSFMIGLAVGGRHMLALLGTMRRPAKNFQLIQAGMVGYALFLWILTTAFQWTDAYRFQSHLLEYGFPLFSLLAGYVGGFHFPLAGHLFVDASNHPGLASGMLNGTDLAGSALGALLCGFLLLPVYGIPATLILTAWLNLFAVALVYWAYRKD